MKILFDLRIHYHPVVLKDQCLQVLAVHLLRVLGWSYAIFCFSDILTDLRYSSECKPIRASARDGGVLCVYYRLVTSPVFPAGV